MTHTVTWWEIQVSDAAVAQKFYGEVFGWTFTPFGDTYVLINGADGAMIGGLDAAARPDPTGGRGTRIYIGVDDLDETLRKVEAAGGEVRTKPTKIDDQMGSWADFTDPGGVTVALWASNQK